MCPFNKACCLVWPLSLLNPKTLNHELTNISCMGFATCFRHAECERNIYYFSCSRLSQPEALTALGGPLQPEALTAFSNRLLQPLVIGSYSLFFRLLQPLGLLQPMKLLQLLRLLKPGSYSLWSSYSSWHSYSAFFGPSCPPPHRFDLKMFSMTMT